MRMLRHNFYLLGVYLFLGAAVPALAGISVTPSHVSMGDTVTVVVKASVSSGAKADVIIYFDSNANGKIDSGEIVWRHFKVQDGQALPPAGAALVVDTDGSTNGSVSVPVFILPSENVVAGHFVIRVASGSSTSDIALTIDPPPGAQSVAGQLQLGGSGKPGAVFILDSSGNMQYPILTDMSGNYTAPLPSPGNYIISGIIPGNSYRDDSGIGVSVSAGQNKKNVNVNLTPASHRWKGQVVRADNQKPVPGIWITGRRESPNLRVSGPTDDNGNFDLGIDDGSWSIKFDDPERMGFSIANYENGDQAFQVSGHDVTGKVYPLNPFAGYVYGHYRNGNTLASLDGIGMQAQDDATNQWLAEATSDANGNFALGMLAGTYLFQPNMDSNSSRASSFLIPNVSFTKTIVAGQNVNLGTLNCLPADGQVQVTVLDYPNTPHSGDWVSGSDSDWTGGYHSGSIWIGSDGKATVPTRDDQKWLVGVYRDNSGEQLVTAHRLDVLAAVGNVLTIYPAGYQKRPYWVFGGSSVPNDTNYPQDSGFKRLGIASGTHTFAGSYPYYVIVAYEGDVHVDTIEGSNGAFFGVSSTFNTLNSNRIGGKGDSLFATIGWPGTESQPVLGSALVYPGATLRGITVIHPNEPFNGAQDWWKYDAPPPAR